MYQPSILYNTFSQFIFVGLSDILYSTLIRFIYVQIDCFLPLLDLKEIQLCNWLKATSEEVLGVILIRLLYPNCYWKLINPFCHSRTWLSIVFNNTLIHLYCHYQKKLEWDEKKLTYETFFSYVMTIYNPRGSSCF